MKRIILSAAFAVLAAGPAWAQGDGGYHLELRDGAGAALDAMADDEPVELLNMVRFRDVAAYADGSGFEDKGWSGEEAFSYYGQSIAHLAERVGFSFAYFGAPTIALIAPEGEDWDRIFVVRYPSAAQFRELMSDAEYGEQVFHREAALADSRLILLTAPTAPTPFNAGQ